MIKFPGMDNQREKRQKQASGKDISDLCVILGHDFKNSRLLGQALTHSSWANESGHGGDHNERLEFLGDAVLELCVSAELYRRNPTAREGELTRMRSNLVSEGALARIAREISLDNLIRLGAGEERQGGRQRDAILCDALEAVIAAVYLDAGFVAASGLVERLFSNYWQNAENAPKTVDYKSRLQEACQHKFHDVPVYALESSSGPEHAKIFNVKVRLPDGSCFYGSNSSCKKAERDAAQNALEALGKDGGV